MGDRALARSLGIILNADEVAKLQGGQGGRFLVRRRGKSRVETSMARAMYFGSGRAVLENPWPNQAP